MCQSKSGNLIVDEVLADAIARYLAQMPSKPGKPNTESEPSINAPREQPEYTRPVKSSVQTHSEFEP